MTKERFALGLDFGSDSVRALIVNVDSGQEEAVGVAEYPRWKDGRYSDPAKNQFRQHPRDYIESMQSAIKQALSSFERGEEIIAIGIDTTGSTVCPVDEAGIPLALQDEFEDNPNAMFVLWKDHTAVKEADEINYAARNWGGTDYTQYSGGIYSAEWFWAKILHLLREDEKVREHAFSWVEHCDWLPALLTGNTDPVSMKRSRCAAGHKAMWHSDWGGLPSEEFLLKINPLYKGLRSRFSTQTYTSATKAGNLTKEWAGFLGLKPGIPVAVGGIDAHVGAVGGGIKEKTLAKIIGTSTCDIMVVSPDILGKKLIKGICGQVNGSVLPGLIGLEAGQSAFGDVYAWFKDLLSWPYSNVLVGSESLDCKTKAKLQQILDRQLLGRLTMEAAKTAIEETGLIALDWLNGRRTPDANQNLKGAIIGLSLSTDAPKIFRALVEATAFGGKAIVDRLASEGVVIDQVVAMGGITQKNSFVMQVISDVLNMPIKVTASEQTCALGAAIFGTVAAGVYPSIALAQEKMGSGFSQVFSPDQENVIKYQRLYREYSALGNNIEEHFTKPI